MAHGHNVYALALIEIMIWLWHLVVSDREKKGLRIWQDQVLVERLTFSEEVGSICQ